MRLLIYSVIECNKNKRKNKIVFFMFIFVSKFSLLKIIIFEMWYTKFEERKKSWNKKEKPNSKYYMDTLSESHTEKEEKKVQLTF
jgi:hypothetical protein